MRYVNPNIYKYTYVKHHKFILLIIFQNKKF